MVKRADLRIQAKRENPYTVRIEVPGDGLGRKLDEMIAWCNAKAGGHWQAQEIGLDVRRHFAVYGFKLISVAQEFRKTFGGD